MKWARRRWEMNKNTNGILASKRLGYKVSASHLKFRGARRLAKRAEKSEGATRAKISSGTTLNALHAKALVFWVWREQWLICWFVFVVFFCRPGEWRSGLGACKQAEETGRKEWRLTQMAPHSAIWNGAGVELGNNNVRLHWSSFRFSFRIWVLSLVSFFKFG